MIPQSDTSIVNLPGVAARDDPLFTKTQYANLYRHKSGKYYCHAKVGGRLVRKSLKTKSLEIAKGKLDDLLSDERAKVKKKPVEEMTCGDLALEYRTAIESAPHLKPRAKEYRLETLEAIERTVPLLWSYRPAAIAPGDIEKWTAKLRSHYSPTRFNGCLQTLRAVLQLAVEHGLVAANPVKVRTRKSPSGVAPAKVPLMPPELPSSDKFREVLAKLDAMPQRHRGAVAVRLLAFLGPRISAAQALRPEHVDFQRNEVSIPPVKYDDKPIRVPIFPQIRKLLKELVEQYPGEGPLMPIANPRKALERACADAGCPKLTPHDLRHLFATRCLECGVDVKTVAEWLGHKDGGALLLKRYAHLRDEHSQKMAKAVRF